MIEGKEALQIIAAQRTDQIVVTTMSTAREWPCLSRRPELDVPLIGAMGKASSLGLGIALGAPDRQVLILDGDGSLLMNLGALVTIGAMAPKNLVHFVFDNAVYETSGGQPVPGAGRVDFAGLARAAGYRAAYAFDDAAQLREALPAILREDGPTLVAVKVNRGWAGREFPPRKTAQALRELRALLTGGA